VRFAICRLCVLLTHRTPLLLLPHPAFLSLLNSDGSGGSTSCAATPAVCWARAVMAGVGRWSWAGIDDGGRGDEHGRLCLLAARPPHHSPARSAAQRCATRLRWRRCSPRTVAAHWHLSSRCRAAHCACLALLQLLPSRLSAPALRHICFSVYALLPRFICLTHNGAGVDALNRISGWTLGGRITRRSVGGREGEACCGACCDAGGIAAAATSRHRASNARAARRA